MQRMCDVNLCESAQMCTLVKRTATLLQSHVIVTVLTTLLQRKSICSTSSNTSILILTAGADSQRYFWTLESMNVSRTQPENVAFSRAHNHRIYPDSVYAFDGIGHTHHNSNG